MYTLFEWVMCSVHGNALPFSTLTIGAPKGTNWSI
jgi:hypothetical protein